MLSEIYSDIENDPAFAHLRTPGIRIVPGYGSTAPGKIFFLGEAPGEMENKTGVPFSGRAGEKFADLLDSIELFSDEFYISNVLKYRPPKNRDPYPSEIHASKPYVRREVSTLQPSLIVPLGKIATQIFFPLRKFREVRGKIFSIRSKDGAHVRKILPLYHPAFACYNEGKPEELTVIREFALIEGAYGSGATA